MRTSRPLLLIALLLGALALVALGGCGDSDDGGDDSTTQEASTTATEQSTACETVELPAPKGTQHLRKPTERLDPSRDWIATVRTNCGTFSIALDVARAPKTTASFAALARRGFYDNLTFHRIAPGFVIQGGDPLGDGTGGPGYTVVEKPPRDLLYTHGVVAMAKTANEPDGASGSQFFVIIGEDGGLPPQYALVGNVLDGLDVIDTIGGQPIDSADPQGSRPLEPIVIESVEISNG